MVVPAKYRYTRGKELEKNQKENHKKNKKITKNQ